MAFISSATWRMSLNIARVTSKLGSRTSAVTCWPGLMATLNQRDWPAAQMESLIVAPLAEVGTTAGVSQVRLFRSGLGHADGSAAVAVVHVDRTVEIRKIHITQDLGRRVQVAQGLSESDQLIINPPGGLATGAIVTIAKARPEPM